MEVNLNPELNVDKLFQGVEGTVAPALTWAAVIRMLATMFPTQLSTIGPGKAD